jgi:YbbR domain-containing protein
LSRILWVIVHNWPLKLAAIGLATLLYGGLVLSQSTQTYGGRVQIQPIGQRADTVLLSAIPDVTTIRYFAPTGVPTAGVTFTAQVDLSNVDPKAGIVSVPVTVRAADQRISILAVEPAFVNIQLDALKSITVPVDVERGTVPDGLQVGDMSFDPRTVVVSGPSTIVAKVSKARAAVIIQPSGIDIDEDVVLVPVDDLGNALSPVDVEPRTVHVKIPVFTDRQTKTVPVTPVVSGSPAAGFEIAALTVTPKVVTVEGDADQLATVDQIGTLPVSVAGASENLTASAGLDLPTGVVPIGDGTVQVVITLRPVTGTRTFDAGLRLVGARSDLTYDIDVNHVLVTIGGSIADLDRLQGAQIVLDLAVGDLLPGTTTVPVTADLTTGLTLVSVSPATVSVTVTAPPSPSPSISLASPSPSGG